MNLNVSQALHTVRPFRPATHMYIRMRVYVCLLCAVSVQAVQRDMSGPVTAIDNLRGMLILAVGHRVELHYKQVHGT